MFRIAIAARSADNRRMNARASTDLETALLGLLDDGRAYTPSELAKAAKASPETARDRLRALERSGLVVTRRQGPHTYFQTAHRTPSDGASGFDHIRTGPGNPAMRAARVCYGHLAGPRGVRLFETFEDRGLIHQDGDAVNVTREGWIFLASFGVDRTHVRNGSRPPCKTCLDWSERRSHLGGPLAAAILDRIVSLGWAVRDSSSRLLTFSAAGAAAFDTEFSD